MFKKPKAKLILNTWSKRADGTMPVSLRVTSKGKKYYPTSVDTAERVWDVTKERLKPCRPKCKDSSCDRCQSNSILDDFMDEYERTILDMRQIYDEFDHNEFAYYFTGKSPHRAGSVLFIIEMKINELEEGIKNGTAGEGTRITYVNTRNLLELFLEAKSYDHEIGFSKIDYSFLVEFEKYLRSDNRKVYAWVRGDYIKRPAKKGLSTTSIGIHMRNFRAIWNLASKKGLTDGLRYPFKDYTIRKGTADSSKFRHLTDEEINKLIARLPEIKSDSYRYESVLMWLAMFFGDGMNSADLCRLEWGKQVTEIGEGEYQIRFRRTKTKGSPNSLEANITNTPLSHIIHYFQKHPNPSPFVFPILLNAWERKRGNLTERDIKIAYTTRNKTIIKYMRKECEGLGFERVDQIDIYTARHSFAVSEYKETKDIHLVSRKLLHTSIAMTQEYLKSLGFTVDETGSETSKKFNSRISTL